MIKTIKELRHQIFILKREYCVYTKIKQSYFLEKFNDLEYLEKLITTFLNIHNKDNLTVLKVWLRLFLGHS